MKSRNIWTKLSIKNPLKLVHILKNIQFPCSLINLLAIVITGLPVLQKGRKTEWIRVLVGSNRKRQVCGSCEKVPKFIYLFLNLGGGVLAITRILCCYIVLKLVIDRIRKHGYFWTFWFAPCFHHVHWITWDSRQSGNEILSVYVILQKRTFYQKILRKMWILRILGACMLIWINFDSFAITYLSSLLQKFHFPEEVVLDSLKT